MPVQIDSLPNNILIKENSHTATLTCYWKVTWRIPFGGVLVPEYRSGYIFINLPENIYWPIDFVIEAWDNLNNSSNKDYTLIKGSNSNFYIDKIYNYPNPFKTETYFTFFPIEDAEIIISIYTVNGKLITNLKKEVNGKELCTLYWDGKDKYFNEISNGTFFYHLLAKNDSGKKFEYISKLTKIK